MTLARRSFRIKAESAKRVVMKLRKAYRKPLMRTGAKQLAKANFEVRAELRSPRGRRIARVTQPIEITKRSANSRLASRAGSRE